MLTPTEIRTVVFTARFGLVPRQVLFVSANGWDAFSAKVFGFSVELLAQAHSGSPNRPAPSAEAVIPS